MTSRRRGSDTRSRNEELWRRFKDRIDFPTLSADAPEEELEAELQKTIDRLADALASAQGFSSVIRESPELAFTPLGRLARVIEALVEVMFSEMGRGNAANAAIAGAALAFATADLNLHLEGVHRETDTAARVEAGLRKGRQAASDARRTERSRRDEQIRKEMDRLTRERGHSIRSAARVLERRFNLSAESIRKIYAKSG